MTETGFPVYGANGQIGFYHSFNHEESTVLITCRGATCGTINISPPKAYITGNAMALDSLDKGKVLLRFLFYALKFRGLGDVITGTAQPQITRQSLKNVEFPLPPLDEQHPVARRPFILPERPSIAGMPHGSRSSPRWGVVQLPLEPDSPILSYLCVESSSSPSSLQPERMPRIPREDGPTTFS